MKIGDVKNIKIARKYAHALFEAGIEANVIDKVYNDILFVVETLKSNEQLADFMYSPLIKISDKKDVVSKLFSVHIQSVTLDFMNVLVDAGRFDVIEEISNQFSNVYNEEKNIVKPLITSAVELNEQQRANLLAKLEMKLNKKIEPEYCVNADIIGGLIVEIGDKTIDCSLKTKFDNMQKQLTKGNKYGND